MLSTTITTFLLSTCFLFFIIWVCCCTKLKNKNRKNSKSERINRSIKETESNLNKLGLTAINPEASNANKLNASNICVRDDSEIINMKSLSRNRSPSKENDQRKSSQQPSISYNPYDLPDNSKIKASILQNKKNEKLNEGFIDDLNEYTNCNESFDSNKTKNEKANKQDVSW